MTDKEKLMQKVQMYDLAKLDSALFCDTHPDDKDAISYCKKVTKLYQDAKKEYEEKYGPLSISSSTNPNRWDWVDKAWPWEVTK